MMTLDTLPLPDGLVWDDEFGFPAQTVDRKTTLRGRVVLTPFPQPVGRNITLSGEDAWMTRDELAALETMARQYPPVARTLTMHDGRIFSVVFRHWEGGLEAHQVDPVSDPGADDSYRITLRFMTV